MDASRQYRSPYRRSTQRLRNREFQRVGMASFLMQQAVICGLLLAGLLAATVINIPAAHRFIEVAVGILRYEGDMLGVLAFVLDRGEPSISSDWQEDASVPLQGIPQSQDTRIAPEILDSFQLVPGEAIDIAWEGAINNDVNRREVAVELLNETPVQAVPPGVARVSSGFGYRTSPITGEEEFHNGVDIALPVGAGVVAIQDGYVTYVGYNAFSGHFMRYATVDGLLVGYAHLDYVMVKVGDSVRQGEIVARSGASGMVSGPHLHVSIWQDGQLLDPLSVFTLPYG